MTAPTALYQTIPCDRGDPMAVFANDLGNTEHLSLQIVSGAPGLTVLRVLSASEAVALANALITAAEWLREAPERAKADAIEAAAPKVVDSIPGFLTAEAM